MGKTMAQELIEKGRKEGRKQGTKQEALRSRRRILLKLLRTRFGELSEQTVTAVESSTSVAELDTWLERFATANTLKEIGIG